ncbi:MAG: hypothetical protein NTW50_01210 [Candidatus Berkelbacteria bacterium]|nr:hypothetical protein [Candidatus Berkelbacteria bacterium]
MLDSKEIEKRFAEKLGLVPRKELGPSKQERRQKIERLRSRYRLGDKIKGVYITITFDKISRRKESEKLPEDVNLTPARNIMAEDYQKIFGQVSLTRFLRAK